MAFVTMPALHAPRGGTGRATSAQSVTAPGSFIVRAPLRARRATMPAPTRDFSVVASMERTYIMAKPDCTQRGLVGKVITKFEDKGFKLVAMKMLIPDRALVEEHYVALKSKPFFGGLVDFLCSGPVVAMIWEGKGVVSAGRKILGATNPLESDPSTIRGAYACDVGRNTAHGSDAPETAEREIALWFKPEEICEWTSSMEQWIYE